MSLLLNNVSYGIEFIISFCVLSTELILLYTQFACLTTKKEKEKPNRAESWRARARERDKQPFGDLKGLSLVLSELSLCLLICSFSSLFPPQLFIPSWPPRFIQRLVVHWLLHPPLPRRCNPALCRLTSLTLNASTSHSAFSPPRSLSNVNPNRIRFPFTPSSRKVRSSSLTFLIPFCSFRLNF